MNSISLCMIVKNEEATLQRCLESVAGIPDEIVIVDTGSDDATKDIAGEFTSRIVDFEWVDDFSAARNFAFAQATMDWIMWLDADDVLLPDDRAKTLRLKETLSAAVDAVSTLYHTAFDESGNVLQTSRLLRLVRRSKNFTWSGVVHEILGLETEFRYLNSDVVVTHMKPAGRSASEPSRSNLEIYEKQLAAGRQLRPAEVLHYARELQKNGEFARAIPQYLQFLELPGGGYRHHPPGPAQACDVLRPARGCRQGMGLHPQIPRVGRSAPGVQLPHRRTLSHAPPVPAGHFLVRAGRTGPERLRERRGD